MHADRDASLNHRDPVVYLARIGHVPGPWIDLNVEGHNMQIVRKIRVKIEVMLKVAHTTSPTVEVKEKPGWPRKSRIFPKIHAGHTQPISAAGSDSTESPWSKTRLPLRGPIPDLPTVWLRP